MLIFSLNLGPHTSKLFKPGREEHVNQAFCRMQALGIQGYVRFASAHSPKTFILSLLY
jgi:hypothetical protein